MTKEKRYIELFEYLRLIVGVVIITSLISMYIFTFSSVRQTSMESTLHQKDLLIVEKLSYVFNKPKKGDIVIFVIGEDLSGDAISRASLFFDDLTSRFSKKKAKFRLVKRIIATEGDVVDIRNGEVYVNDVQLVEPYIKTMSPMGDIAYPYTVPEDGYFVMGDNREVSRDSRYFGAIDKDNIEGKVFLRVLPFRKFGKVK